MFRRRIDRLLSGGEGVQLLWLAVLVFVLYGAFCLIGRIWGLDWTDILTLYLDPGNFPIDHKANDIFSLIVTLCGILILSALTISAFGNVFENVASAYAEGRRRYKFSGHVLILGADASLERMLSALRDEPSYAGKEIVVMSSGEVEPLRQLISSDKALLRRVTFYSGDWTDIEGLRGARAAYASVIYICGEKDDPARDDSCVRCHGALRELCAGEGAPIRCYLKLSERSTMEIFRFAGAEKECRLETESINIQDYTAEQLLVESDFLPAFGPDDTRHLNLVISGMSPLAEAVALTASQICHYPSFGKAGRTRLTFVGDGMRAWMDDFTAANGNIFTLSHWRYVSADGEEVHAPDPAYGDFLDVEWCFVEGSMSSPLVRKMLSEPAENEVLRVALCGEDSARNLADAVHLERQPRPDRGLSGCRSELGGGLRVAVYQRESCAILDKAAESGQFGAITAFGESVPGNDILLTRRSLRGSRVNYVYDKAYGNPPAASEEKAWFPIPLAHKLSSIASAASIPLKLRSFRLQPTEEAISALSEEQLESLSEVEHRRWMATALVLGYRALPKAQRSDRSDFKRLKNEEFIHLDIAPFDEIADEQEKDTIIVREIPYIMA